MTASVQLKLSCPGQACGSVWLRIRGRGQCRVVLGRDPWLRRPPPSLAGGGGGAGLDPGRGRRGVFGARYGGALRAGGGSVSAAGGASGLRPGPHRARF